MSTACFDTINTTFPEILVEAHDTAGIRMRFSLTTPLRFPLTALYLRLTTIESANYTFAAGRPMSFESHSALIWPTMVAGGSTT
jgi:hypothetical protein